jgi:hypothetical protein
VIYDWVKKLKNSGCNISDLPPITLDMCEGNLNFRIHRDIEGKM